MNKYIIFNDQNNFLHILVRVVIIKAYRLKYNWMFVKNPIISWRLRIFGLSQDPSNKKTIY